MDFDIKDVSLAEQGRLRAEWASGEMPVLLLLKDRFEKNKPLKGLRIGGCLHITTETANLAAVLKAGGADVALCASNPLSTQDDAAAHIVRNLETPVFAIKGEDGETYYRHINAVLDTGPVLTVDDGADLVSTIHKKRRDLLSDVIGGTEETTTGLVRLRSMDRDGVLAYPIIAVNDAQTKHFFDNRYGTGQSTMDGIIRATNLLMAGRRVVVFGYGWCGRGVAMRARGLGARVIVCEVDPLKALEAVMDGYDVMPSPEAAKVGDVFVTLTGNTSVLRREHFELMRDGAVLANSGHFNVEVDIPALETMAESRRKMRPFVEEFRMRDGRRLYLLAEGRLINLASAEGHPAAVMDMSFANQALSLAYLAANGRSLDKHVHPVPSEIDAEVARLKLAAMGIGIDSLTTEQQRYLSSWEEGT
jgi:adenosylhomocysteinase